MSTNKAGNILVLDVEGTDSAERGDLRQVSETTCFDLFQNIERITSSFSLTMADVLIFNMWTHDVGKDAAANYPVLRDIF